MRSFGIVGPVFYGAPCIVELWSFKKIISEFFDITSNFFWWKMTQKAFESNFEEYANLLESL